MRVWIALCLLALVAVAGCLGEGTDGLDGATNGQAGQSTAPVDRIFNGTKCLVQAAVIPIDPAAAYQWLPPGYAPADAADLLGLPLPAGQAALGIANVQCADSDAGAFDFQVPLVFIETPDIDAPFPPNMVSGYAPGWIADQESLQAIMKDVQLEPRAATGTMEVSVEGSTILSELRSISQLGATWSDAGTDLWTSEATGLAPFDFRGDGFLAWTDHAEGTTVYQAGLAIPAAVEEITFSVGTIDCSAGPGTLAALMIGNTECPSQSIALNVLDFEFADSGFRFFPGVHA